MYADPNIIFSKLLRNILVQLFRFGLWRLQRHRWILVSLSELLRTQTALMTGSVWLHDRSWWSRAAETDQLIKLQLSCAGCYRSSLVKTRSMIRRRRSSLTTFSNVFLLIYLKNILLSECKEGSWWYFVISGSDRKEFLIIWAPAAR